MIKLLGGLCLIVLLCGCDGYTEIEGHIRDEAGQGIEFASVVLEEPSLMSRRSEELTDKSGHFAILLTHAPGALMSEKIKLSVSKDGYETLREEVEPSTWDHALELTLKAVKPQPAPRNEGRAPN